jgi:YD repeat-containing protein
MAAKEKLQFEKDYVGPYGLEFTRYYSSTMLVGSWSHTYSRSLKSNWKVYLPDTPTFPPVYAWDPAMRRWVGNGGKPSAPPAIYVADITGPDGYGHHFESTDNAATWHAEADVNATLTVLEYAADRSILKWRMTTEGNDAEIYDAKGKLIAIEFSDGRVQTLTYSAYDTPADIAPESGLLIQVADNFGRQLQFRYNAASRLVKLIDPAGNEYAYTYHPNFSMVDSVTHPDGLKRVYHYEEPEHVLAPTGYKRVLTGISDEISPGNLVRYGIYKWNKDVPASSEHAGGVDKHIFDFAAGKVTDPLGAVHSYGYAVVNGRMKVSDATQPNGNGSDVYSTVTYDVNGNARASYDLNRVRTVRNFDLTRNLETSRTEAPYTPNARTTTTQWHPTLRLPVAIAAPLLRTTLTYDTVGRLTGMTTQATTDANGTAAFGATLIGKARNWSQTYTDAGLLRTKRGPRTDVDDTTSYEYDVAGNLTKITNAANHVVTLSNYDANGHPGRITDANGQQTDLTYGPRGWLTSSTSGTEVTSYDYDGVGHMTRAYKPNGMVLSYSYDAAQRLTGIADNQGNSITYTLDNTGNQLSEQVRDPNGTLARQSARVYDVLGRLKQVTGAQQ